MSESMQNLFFEYIKYNRYDDIRMIWTVKEKIINGFLNWDFRGKHEKQKSLDSNIKELIKKHIELFLTIESHYPRKQTTKT